MADRIPEQGWSREQVFEEMHRLRERDVDWRDARTFGLIYPTTEEIDAFVDEVALLTLHENALNPFAFPSLKDMQRDVVRMAAALLNGDGDVGGAMTSGGTESIFMAVKTARDKARAERNQRTGNVVVPFTAHPAFHKSCHLLDLEWRQLPHTEDLRADPGAMADAIDDQTLLCVGSAPAYPYGMIDDIPTMAATAAERGVLFHVDACVGGYLLPFVERNGVALPEWDFRVPGVTSISADLHKFGYCVKGASTILQRPKSNLAHQVYQFDQWAGGIYGTMAFQGTKAASPIAISWALLHHLGLDGYTTLMADALSATATVREAVAGIDGVHVWGEPDATVMALGSHDHDIFAIGDVLAERGWMFDRQHHPDSLHLMVSPGHRRVAERFVDDLRFAVANAKDHSQTRATYGDDVSDEAGER
jgi:sphinganine-1-phosphate aldolase